MIVRCLYDKLVPISELKLNPDNRNVHPKDQIDRLAEILKYQGWRYPVKVSNQTGMVTSGHGRVEASVVNQWTQVPVNFQDYDTPEQEYADTIADNAIASWAELNLSGINKDIQIHGPELKIEMLGMRDFRVEPADKVDPQCDEDEVPEHVEPITRRGDCYRLGPHRLLCGDSTSVDDVEKLMAGEKADMVWTDPPYNVAYVGKTKDALTIQNDEMNDSQFYQFLYDAYSNMLLACKAGAAIYVAHADTEGANFRKALKDSGWLLKQCIIWVKQSLVMGRQDYHWQHEPILYGWVPGASHHWYTDRKQSTIFNCKRPSRSTEHPTMKPIELIEYFIGNSSRQGDLVLDTFGGSGSTLIACEKTQRRANLCELEPKYCDVIIARYEKYTGKKAELING